MDSVYEVIKIALLGSTVGLLMEILRYLKMIWSKLFDIHIVVVHKDDPKKYGGGKI